LKKALETLGFPKIRDLVRRIYITQALRAAVERNEFDKFSLIKKYGLSVEDIEYLWSVFPEIKIGKKLMSRQILSHVNELNQKLDIAKSKMLGESELWIFPKWRELIGAVYMGMYRKQKNYYSSKICRLYEGTFNTGTYRRVGLQ